MEAALVISAVVGTVATISSLEEQRKSARAQQRQQQIATQRSQRQAVREAQIRRAQAQATAQAAGAVGGSGLAGGLSSLQSQVGAGLGYSTQMSGLSQEISMANYRANLYGGIAGLSGNVFQYEGGTSELKKLFK